MAKKIKCPQCDGSGFLDSKDVHIGVIIAVRRKELKMTQDDLSKVLGVHRATVANIESGRHTIELKRLRSYADALKVDVLNLIP